MLFLVQERLAEIMGYAAAGWLSFAGNNKYIIIYSTVYMDGNSGNTNCQLRSSVELGSTR